MYSRIPEELSMEGLVTLLKVDRTGALGSRYLPVYPAVCNYTDPHLGVHVSSIFIRHNNKSVGSYYAGGMSPVRIKIEDRDVRAVRGGTGHAKCGGNYAASLRAGEKAEEEGFSQVLWLDGVHRRYVEEVGSMNVMFKINGTVVTPELSGSVLPGITRKSCIEILGDKGIEVQERPITIDELIEAARDGSLQEAWGTGTAAVISPIGEISYRDESYIIGGNRIGFLTRELYDILTGIQWGRTSDPYGWVSYRLVLKNT